MLKIRCEWIKTRKLGLILCLFSLQVWLFQPSNTMFDVMTKDTETYITSKHTDMTVLAHLAVEWLICLFEEPASCAERSP